MGNHYVRLAAMAALSFLAMFVLMYAMVDRLANVVPNLNQFYMAGLMAAPMVVIERVRCLLALPGVAGANYAWSCYHWARPNNPLQLNVGDNVTSTWDAYLDTLIR